MRSFRRFTSGETQAAAARFPDFLLAMASPLKKSSRAAERKRADVARARRRWIREQGFLDPARGCQQTVGNIRGEGICAVRWLDVLRHQLCGPFCERRGVCRQDSEGYRAWSASSPAAD